ncbi:transporter [Silvimonas iriomotensis]|uniref:Phenol degradation protein meta n=1 Tax=Silvimonas iriomotensis TaxID=449662 RepID=A0ABQ2PAB2_9NEIS|nr:transporter [Silvimonas iriomotensis]GGP22055.1 hypothetical protein GCM10010970_23230 [Silvimonas iriomotensis]
MAQADNARDWQNLPIDTPIGFAYYFHVDSNTSLDTNLPIKDANASIDVGLARFAYAWTGLGDKVAGIQVLQPYANVDLSLPGTAVDHSRRGWGDTNIVLVQNIFGGPALTLDQFMRWKPETFLSAAVWVTAPTGSYDANKTVNTGANRWAVKPELAFGHPFGNSWIEANAWVQWFGNNDEYLGHQTLKQDPKIGLEGHYSYSFSQAFWASVDLYYNHGGQTKVNNLVQSEGGSTWQGGFGAQLLLSPADAISASYTDTLSKPDGGADAKVYMLSYRRIF